MRKFSFLHLLALLVLVIFALSCGPSKPAAPAKPAAAVAEPIKIGALLSLTGSSAANAQAMKLTMQVAQDDINAGGGVLGRQVQIIIVDDQLKADLGTTLTRKLITDDKVVGLVGGYTSAVGLAAAAVCKELQVPIVGMGMSDAGAKPVNPYAFCYLSLNYYAVRAMLTRIKSLGHTRIAYYYTDTAWGTGGLDTLNRLLAQPDFSSMKLVDKQGTPLGATDVTLQTTKMRDAKAQSVIILNYDTESAAFYRAKKALNWKPHVMSVIGPIAAVMSILPKDMIAGTEVVDWFATENNPAAQGLLPAPRRNTPTGTRNPAWPTLLMMNHGCSPRQSSALARPIPRSSAMPWKRYRTGTA